MDHSTLITHCRAALRSTHEVYLALGASGVEPVQHNIYGDHALRGDVACEEAVISYCQHHQLPIRILSEEHGITDIVEHPQFLLTLDGIDGSIRYKTFFEGDADARFGTIMTLFGSLNPCYSDYLCAGSLEHSHSLLFFCEKGQGVTEEHLPSGTITTRHKAETSTFSTDTRIYIDSNPHIAHYPLLEEVFITPLTAHTLICLLSSAAHYADMATGAVDLVLECTRKGNLEIAYGYAFTTEAGGVMLNFEGEDLGPLRFLSFGQQESVPTIAACSLALARECLDFLVERSGSSEVQ